MITLTADDGHWLNAYAKPVKGGKAGIVVLQEIFGVNAHIRSVADRVADEGYAAIAPALFDRKERGFESGYTPDEVASARRFLADVNWETSLLDVKAAVDHLLAQGLKVGVLGFCFGGSLAYLAATRIPGVSAAVGYYGGYIVQVKDEVPACPTMLHFAERDHTIPMTDAQAVHAARPEVAFFTYDAGHGFNRDVGSSYDPESAALAWQRTMDLFRRTLLVAEPDRQSSALA